MASAGSVEIPIVVERWEVQQGAWHGRHVSIIESFDVVAVDYFIKDNNHLSDDDREKISRAAALLYRRCVASGVPITRVQAGPRDNILPDFRRKRGFGFTRPAALAPEVSPDDSPSPPSLRKDA